MNLAVAFSAQPYEIVILRDHLPARPREVQGEGRHVAAQIVDPEDQLLGQVRLCRARSPSHAQGREPELVAGGIDRLDARQAEVPDQIRAEERRHETAAGRIDVDRNVEPGRRLQVVQRLR